MEFRATQVLSWRDVEPTWRLLYAQAEQKSVFSAPGWIETWLEQAAPDSRIFFLTGEEGGEVALGGLFGVQMKRRPPVIGERLACFHEYGDPNLDAVYVEYNDFLMKPGLAAEVREKAIHFLLTSVEADSFVFRNVRTFLAEAIDAASRRSKLCKRTLGKQPSFQVQLSEISDYEQYLQSLSANARTQIRRSIRGFEEIGPLSIRAAANKEETDAAWNNLVRLHGNSWRARDGDGAFANKHLVDFHKRLMGRSPDMTDILECRAGEKLIGVLYNIVEGGVVSNYQSGFVVENDNKLRPGLVTHVLAIEHYATTGFQTYDMLAGDADYKRKLGREGESLTTIVLDRSDSLRGQALGRFREFRSRLHGAGKHQT